MKLFKKKDALSNLDIIAIQAMQAIIQKDPQHCKLGVDANWQTEYPNFINLAKCSYIIAKFMLAEREKHINNQTKTQ